MRSSRLLVIFALVAAVFAVSPALADDPPAAPVPWTAAPPCPLTADVVDVGPACSAGPGLLKVFSPSGEFLGYTHGPDPIWPDDGSGDITTLAARAPTCVAGLASEYYIQVIYARATDDADGYAALAPTIRGLVESANGLVYDAASATGGHADLKVKCASGVIEVKNEVLPTAKASASFSSIVTDLRAKGYTSRAVKYWVYYDDTGACSCTGTGHRNSDDRLILDNYNNGFGTGSMLAVTFGYTGATGVRTMLHELGHTMGAVASAAPHTTAAGHCWDGKDTMCYDDGGPNSSSCVPDFYCSSVCATEVFDCGKDDYFSRAPAGGSYLATHWNIGNALNRFINFGIPDLSSLSCTTPRGVTQSVTCTMLATDDNSGVRYAIGWGDATTSCAPSCATYATPGVATMASHTYSSGGTKTVNVTATDNGSPAQTSSFRLSPVVIDATPPVTVATLGGTAGTGGWYRSNVTITLGASDAGGTGVDDTFVALDGAAYALYSAVLSATTDGAHSVSYYSTDVGLNVESPKTTGFAIDRTAPTASALPGCDPCIGSVSIAWSAADAASKLSSATLRWTLAPVALASGVVCSPTVTGLATASGSCSFAGWLNLVPGQYCFALTATDVAGNARTTPSACVTLV